MFSTSNNFSPVLYANHYHTMSESSLTTGAPNPTPVDHPSPFLEFSSFFLNEDDPAFGEIISQQQQHHGTFVYKDDLEVESPGINPSDSREGTSVNNKKKKNNVNALKKPRRTGKKDRHSKIYTAQGPRDRRMRLSLQIARKFFDLQDMLGFDKASKTIEWLFSKSKSAIKELTDNLPRVTRSNRLTDNCVSSTSASEVVSGMKLTEHIEDGRSVAVAEANSHWSNPMEQKSKKSHKTALNRLARESRDKARARARERTREKMKIKGLEKAKRTSQENPSILKQKEPKSPKGNDQKLSTGSQELKSFKDDVGEEGTDLLQHRMDSVSISNKIMEVIRAPRSSLIFDFSHSVAATSATNIEEEITGFPVNWDISIGRTYHRQCTMRNTNMSTGNVNLLNPNSIFTGSGFLVPKNSQEQNLTSIFMGSQDQYCDSVSLANTSEQHPNSIPIPSNSNTSRLQSHFKDNQWPRGPFFIKYGK